MVQNISSGQTFTNILKLPCDLEVECSNPIFLKDTPAYGAVLSNQIWLQMNHQSRRYSRKSYFDYRSPCHELDIEDSEPRQSYFDYRSPCCDLDIEDSEPIFLHGTLPHDNIPHTEFG